MKKNIKKTTAGFLACVVLLCGAACGNKETAPKTTNIVSEQLQEKPAEKETQKQEEEQPAESVLFEGQGVVIYNTGFEEDWLGQTIKVRIENNTEKNLTIQTREESVNGYMVDPIFSVDVGAGKKAVGGITFMDSSLEEAGITEIETIEFKIHWFNSDSWTDDFDSEMITLNFE